MKPILKKSIDNYHSTNFVCLYFSASSSISSCSFHKDSYQVKKIKGIRRRPIKKSKQCKTIAFSCIMVQDQSHIGMKKKKKIPCKNIQTLAFHFSRSWSFSSSKERSWRICASSSRIFSRSRTCGWCQSINLTQTYSNMKQQGNWTTKLIGNHH